MGAGPFPPRRATLLLLLAVCATFWSQFAWVKTTNFEGFDEWLLLSLTARGVVSAPHANRPLQWMWHLPASLTAPFSLAAPYLLHGTYMMLAGCLVALLVMRLLPKEPLLALLAGTLSVCWAPFDVLRLTPLYALSHAGTTCGMVLSVVLLVESVARGSRLTFAVGLATAWATARGYEAVLPVFLAAPALLSLLTGVPSRRRWACALLWWAVVGTAAVQAALPLFARSDAQLYQLTLKPLDLRPEAFVRGLATQFRHHLGPLLTVPPFTPAAALSAVVFLGLGFLARPGAGAAVERPQRRTLALVLLAGLLAAGLGYSALVLGTITDAGRTQFFSGPGIGVALAGAILLAASALPRKGFRRAGALLLAAWVVAAGTTYTLAKQAFWDARGYYFRQRQVLAAIVERAPDLERHTLVMLLDDSKSWDAAFSFRHAIEFLYPGRATGYVWGAADYFYPLSAGPSGFRCEPWPAVRGPWGSAVTLHGYTEIVVFRADTAGRLELLAAWPQALPPLPAGTAYAPEARILPLHGAPPASRRLIAARD